MVPQIDVTKATNRILFVTTTIHISGELLKRLDQRARALGISRNRVILEAIEASLGSNETWPPELKRMLATPIDSDEFEKSHKFEKSPRSVRALRVYRRRAPAL
jgi:predicted transcriptional regulator